MLLERYSHVLWCEYLDTSMTEAIYHSMHHYVMVKKHQQRHCSLLMLIIE